LNDAPWLAGSIVHENRRSVRAAREYWPLRGTTLAPKRRQGQNSPGHAG